MEEDEVINAMKDVESKITVLTAELKSLQDECERLQMLGFKAKNGFGVDDVVMVRFGGREFRARVSAITIYSSDMKAFLISVNAKTKSGKWSANITNINPHNIMGYYKEDCLVTKMYGGIHD